MIFGLAGFLLDAAEQFIFLAFLIFQVVVSKIGVLLFDAALPFIPSAFDFHLVHNVSFLVIHESDAKSMPRQFGKGVDW